ncbi:MAG: hypothetical protein WCP79_14525 [Bacillota bacterium]
MDLEYIETQIKKQRRMMLRWSKLKEELPKEPAGFNDLLCKKYLKFSGLRAVVNYLRDEEIKRPSGTYYTTDDISNLFHDDKPDDVSEIIFAAAKSKYKQKGWGVKYPKDF